MIGSEGWDGLLRHVAATALDAAPEVAAVTGVLLSMDGRIPVDQGLDRLPRESRELLRRVAALPCRAVAATEQAEGMPVGLSRTGQVWAVQAPDGSEPLVRVLGGAAAAELDRAVRRWAVERRTAETERLRMRDWLAAQPGEAVDECLDRLGHLLRHMAPVQLHVGDACFSNLGRGNLPGRLVSTGAPADTLARLRSQPVGAWSGEEAAFVTACWVLITSGPPSRLEEANGCHLDLRWLSELLRGHAERYGVRGVAPESLTEPEALMVLAARLAERRAELLGQGTVFYREIHGVSLNKRERSLPAVPDARSLARPQYRWSRWSAQASTLADMGREAAHQVQDAAVGKRPAVRAEILRDLLQDLAAATDSDVTMARGPRELFFVDDSEPERHALALSTTDFYCCVVPSGSFADQHRGAEPSLDKILAAYSARMRFNSWHYLPHVLGQTDDPRRDDWFFAPTMPDLTHHSEWHHTGHVRFGVRHAMRVPLQVALDGRTFPGLYDLRLMRAGGVPFTAADLATAVAFGQVLRVFHEEMYRVCRDKVTEFDNAWFRSTYA